MPPVEPIVAVVGVAEQAEPLVALQPLGDRLVEVRDPHQAAAVRTLRLE